MDILHDIDGDGDHDLLMPAPGGISVYKWQNKTFLLPAIDHVRLPGNISYLGDLPEGLVELNLSKTSIEECSSLSSLVHLREIVLADADIGCIEKWPPHVEKVDLNGAKVENADLDGIATWSPQTGRSILVLKSAKYCILCGMLMARLRTEAMVRSGGRMV